MEKEKETGENKRANYIKLLDIHAFQLQVSHPCGLPLTQASDKQHSPTSSEQEGPSSHGILQREGLSIKEVPCLCPLSLPNQVVIPQQRSPYLSQSSPTPQAGRQAGRAGRRFQDLPTSSPHQQPQRYLLTITTTMMAQIAPSMIII